MTVYVEIITLVLFFVCVCSNEHTCISNEKCIRESMKDISVFCWPDGKCRREQPIAIVLSKQEIADNDSNEEQSFVRTNNIKTHGKINITFDSHMDLNDGDRMCITTFINPLVVSMKDFSMDLNEFESTPLIVSFYDLVLCSTNENNNNNGKYSYGSHKYSLDMKDNNKANIHVTPMSYIRPYSAENHFSTGCQTKTNLSPVRYQVIIQDGIIKKGNNEDNTQVSISTGNLAATACFNVKALGTSKSPVFVQSSVKISRDHTNSETKLPYIVKAFGFSESQKEDGITNEDKNRLTDNSCINKNRNLEKDKKYHDKLAKNNRNEKKNKQLEKRHRRNKHFRIDPILNSFVDNDSSSNNNNNKPCYPFILPDGNIDSRVITVTSSDIIPHSHIKKIAQNIKRGESFNYENMQEYEGSNNEGFYNNLKHYYYYENGNGGSNYYHNHPHIHCHWTLTFNEGAGICESIKLIDDRSTHIFVIVLATIGSIMGVIFCIYDWKSGALFL